MARTVFYLLSALAAIAVAALGWLWPPAWALVLVVAPVIALGLHDILQPHRAILRNYPVVGHLRYLLESIRPEIMQYFIEQNLDGRPVNRELRSIIYQRAKGQLDTLPFGTQRDVYAVGYEWLNHSLAPLHPGHEQPRVTIGGRHCSQPYSSAVLNVSAMSYGSLSANAIRALNAGARRGGFSHNSGEGGLSPYHLEPGGDLVWQIGTGYFGCRAADGGFDPSRFADNACRPTVKMIELKLSQGAKPGHGGILPAAKVTPEIAAIRGIRMGEDVISPPAHSAFSTPAGLLELVHRMRELCGGKPVGFKLCVGRRREFLALCKAMVETGLTPDFITVDGGEGGTGAAPLEFSNSVGGPLIEALIFVHNALVGFDLRGEIKVVASGQVHTGFDLVRRLAIGADLCNAARSMMFALGCIQALRCNSNTCPTGVATQDPRLVRGLHVGDKSERVWRYQKETVESMMDLLGAAAITHPEQLGPYHLQRRTSPTEIRHYEQIYHFLSPGELLAPPFPEDYRLAMATSSAETFDRVG